MMVGAAGAVAGLTLTSSCTRYIACTCPQGFKIGVCDWTIGKRANPGSLEAARQIGLDGVQVDFGKGDTELPLFDPKLQKRFLDEVQNQKMEIASLAMGVLNDIPYKSDPRAERWVAEGIDVAKAMRADIILLAFFGNGDLLNDEQGTNEVIKRLRNVAPKAEKAGVTLAIESWLSAEQHVDIIQRVGSPAVKVYYDVGNSHKQGYNIYSEIRRLGRFTCQFHAKDYDDLYGKGSIDFEKIRAAMDDIGYRGWLVMEGTKMPLGVEESCRHDAEYLRTIFPPSA
jgi:sugar phosphate isomerase/epimerase